MLASVPSTMTAPLLGRISSPMQSSIVVFPLPDRPTIARNSPCSMLRSTPSSAFTMDSPMPYVLLRPSVLIVAIPVLLLRPQRSDRIHPRRAHCRDHAGSRAEGDRKDESDQRQSWSDQEEAATRVTVVEQEGHQRAEEETDEAPDQSHRRRLGDELRQDVAGLWGGFFLEPAF